MRKSLKYTSVILTAGLLTMPANAASLPAPTASYDASIASDINGNQNTSTINAVGPKQRIVVHLSNGDQTVLINRSTGKVYLLMPAMNAAMQLDAQTMHGYNLTALNSLPATAEEDEQVGGVDTTRYAIDAEDKNGRFAGHVWSTQNGAILKIEGMASTNGKDTPVKIELSNFHERPQNPALVSLPRAMKVVPFGLAGLLGSQKQYPAPAN